MLDPYPGAAAPAPGRIAFSGRMTAAPSKRARVARSVVVFSSCVLIALALVASVPTASAHRLPRGRYLYIAANGSLRVFRFGTWQPVARYSMPRTLDGVRGVDASPSGHSLFIAHGGDGGVHGRGRLLKWNLVTDTVAWDRSYPFGVDQLAACSGKIYMPTGEQAAGAQWKTLRQSDGKVIGTLTGGGHPHNTICHHGRVYMGGRTSRYLFVKDLTNGTVRRVGPSPSRSPGVRPFTVNAADTRAYITWTDYRGFSVANVKTGAVIASRRFGPVPSWFKPTAPSHGISLSHDGSRVYVLDAPTHTIQVWTATDRPAHLKTISIPGPTGAETPCAYDCLKDGWVLTSITGRYVLVGDSGAVIDTRSNRVVATIPGLAQNRHGYLEIDWAGGVPRATSTHFGIGR